MISITIKVHHGMQKYLAKAVAGKRLEISLPEGSTLEHLLNEKVGLPPDLPLLIIVNGIHSKPSQLLKQDDRVSVFMPMAGG